MLTVADWLLLHGLHAPVLRDVLTAYYMGELPDCLLEDEELPIAQSTAPCVGSKEECFENYVIPALVEGFPGNSDIAKTLRSSEFKSLTIEQVFHPNTLDLGVTLSLADVMCWRARPEDLMYLARETAHTLQVLLSGPDTMPPIARETCKFIGELLLLRFVQKHDPAVFHELQEVWVEKNEGALLDDLDSLADGLLNPETLCHYNQNYPLARLAAVQLIGGDDISLGELFSSGASAMKHLPIEQMAARTAALTDYFPRNPCPSSAKPSFERDWGAATEFDLETSNNWIRSKFQQCEAAPRTHFFEDAILIWLSGNRRPMGCVTWTRRSTDGTSDVTWLTAPFGGHVRLEPSLDIKRIPANSNELHQFGEPT
ncbi:hypothetical protein [uncultured Tateyamaria sp.]|uniref:hypothetical protein n=1 Tax=uncultured Tateyamaria sp. TaxID=455651 RepID=UPI002625EFBC|nr:hypothetical protein [uncultured Tateyamaria sp.]